MTAAILVVLLSLIPYHGETETISERRDRLTPVAQAIAGVCEGRPLECAANLITTGKVESGFARYVGEGCLVIPPGAGHCDRDRHGNPRAATYWQLWAVACRELIHKMVPGSLRQLRAAAACADRRLRYSAHRCRGRNAHGDLGGMFAGYRSVDCAWTGSAARGVVRRIFVRGVVLRRLRRAK